jgi:hypothetical protein
MYFGSTSLAVVPGEHYEYAGFPITGNGKGPFHTLSLNIRVEAGDSLVLGIRSNGRKSTVCPFSKLNGEGWFLADGFKLFFLSDPYAFVQKEIQEGLNRINAFPTDSLPGGYEELIRFRNVECQQFIKRVQNVDSLEIYREELKGFLVHLQTAKISFANLKAVMDKSSDIVNGTNYANRDSLVLALSRASNIFYSSSSLMADFDRASSELNTALHTYLFTIVPENMAKSAVVTTSKVSAWEKLSAVNDGFEPASSTDRTHGIYGNWNGTQYYNTVNWIQYTWERPFTLTGVSVYWFTDYGGLLQPDSAVLEYWKNDAWQSAGTVDTLLNKWNNTKVNNLTVDRIRICFKSPTSTGVVEFKAMGVQKLFIPASEYLRWINSSMTVIDSLSLKGIPNGYLPTAKTYRRQIALLPTSNDSVDLLLSFHLRLAKFKDEVEKGRQSWLDLTALTDSAQTLMARTQYLNKNLLLAATNKALVVRSDSSSLAATLVTAGSQLKAALTEYLSNSMPYNLAKDASVSTSFVSSWLYLSSINDGFTPTSSTDYSHKCYGNWNGDADFGKLNWVQYDWPEEKAIYGAYVYWFADYVGLLMPDTAYLEYWSGIAWKTAGSIGVVENAFNALPLNIRTKKVRLSMKSATSTGILEFAVQGAVNPPAPKPLHLSTDTVQAAPGIVFDYPLNCTEIAASDSVVSYQFQLNYDPNLLKYVECTQANTVSATGVLQVNANQSGVLKVAYMDDEFLSGSGKLLNLRFMPVRSGSTTPKLSNIVFNTKNTISSSDGVVNIRATYGDVDGNNLIQAYDAAMVLRYSVGADPMPALDALPWADWRVYSGDVDGNQSLTAYDAGLILQRSIDLIVGFPVETTPLRSSLNADVTMTLEDGFLVFRSYGNLVGLNVDLQTSEGVLGTPRFSDNALMNATNMAGTDYKIGLAATTQPIDGSVVLKVPVLQKPLTDPVVHLLVNATSKDLRANIVTGLSRNEQVTLDVYPNPVLDKCIVRTVCSAGCTIRLTNLLGKTIRTCRTSEAAMELDASDLAKGVYLLQVFDRTNTLLGTRKLIKQ